MKFVCEGEEWRATVPGKGGEKAKHTVKITRWHQATIETSDLYEAEKRFCELTGAELRKVNGLDVEGHCECCESPVLDTMAYYGEGPLLFCSDDAKCLKRAKKNLGKIKGPVLADNLDALAPSAPPRYPHPPCHPSQPRPTTPT